MVRLEAAARALKETLPSSTSRFVSFTPNSQFTFKKNRLSEAVREERTVRLGGAGLYAWRQARRR
jgi:hypothetical protein